MRATVKDIKAANRIYRRRQVTFWAIVGLGLLWAGVMFYMLMSVSK